MYTHINMYTSISRTSSSQSRGAEHTDQKVPASGNPIWQIN